jgi:maltose alpha-D-glucosyltransferase / alpha-amylase
MAEERWYKHAIIYALDVRTFLDSDGDGIGDFQGLIDRLDYLAGLGVTCLWLLPIHPSPWRDDGYDVTDHYGVHPELGTAGTFVELLREASERGFRVIIDLVLNHTSDEHPWFQEARSGDARFRDFYVWSKERAEDAETGVVFPGHQRTTWTYDRKAGAYYFHRFYDFQPDLNIANPRVRREMARIMGYWATLGLSGYRMDAIPFLIEPAGAGEPKPGPRFEYLHQLRQHLSWIRGDAVLLGEANVGREEIDKYFGVGGMHMLFNFMLNQRVFLALARSEAAPIVEALQETAGIPEADQWAVFLRNHDELDLGRLSEEERQEVFDAFGPEPAMQLYGRGIRRRLAPMLGGDRRRLEMAYSLLFTLPGTPVIRYGDEIGMGDDLSLPERDAIRTPMQWSGERNAGFSAARSSDLVVPVVGRGEFGYRRVNVADQRRDQSSLLNWFVRMIRARKECPEFGIGSCRVIPSGSPRVLVLVSEAATGTALAVHNLSDRPDPVRLELDPRWRLEEWFADGEYQDEERRAEGNVDVGPYGYRWFRVT